MVRDAGSVDASKVPDSGTCGSVEFDLPAQAETEHERKKKETMSLFIPIVLFVDTVGRGGEWSPGEMKVVVRKM